MAEELIAFACKQEMLAKSKQSWNPGKTQLWIDSGVPPVTDQREGYSSRRPWRVPPRPVPPYPTASNQGSQPDGEPGMNERLTLVREVRPNERPVPELVNLSADAFGATGLER